MQISNVISGLTDPSTWGKKSDSAVPNVANAIKLLEPQVQANVATQKASVEILRKYDVTNISPNEFTQMIQKLYQAGTMSEKDYQELSAVRSDLEHEGVDADEKTNMLEFLSNMVSRAQKKMGTSLEDAGQQKQLGPDMRRLDWLQKFAMIQANPDAAGLDMAA